MDKVFTVFVEKKQEFSKESHEYLKDIRNILGIKSADKVRVINKYDISGITREDFNDIKYTVLSEKNTDDLYEENIDLSGSRFFLTEYHEGQYDQRADSAAQCIQLITKGNMPKVKTGRVIAVYGNITDNDLMKIKKYYINAVEAKEGSMDKKTSLDEDSCEPKDVEIIDGFNNMGEKELKEFIASRGLSLNIADIVCIRDYFKAEDRNPTITEIRVLDTYWSDHCRHTTFQRNFNNIEIEDGKYSDPIKESYNIYKGYREKLYAGKDKPITLMDMAVIGMKKLRDEGELKELDQSEEINACSIVIEVDVDGELQEYLLMFKNETHNHPTEIEPFGGASTCLGGAIRDPLSGRSYVFGAMRITGSGDPNRAIEDTLKGKLPQRKITMEAANGYSSYGNQIGLATGYVREIYDEGYVAKRMEVGAVIGAAPKENVVRETPTEGDVVILVGGRTGRDGIGGASGSSKGHTEKSIETCGSEVQKGNAPTERKIQRLFRRIEVSSIIKRCNDFGAGGVSVAVGELADGLNINLDAVLKKYEGLDGTEIAISESQERMAVVVRKEDEARFIKFCEEENLEAVVVAVVTKEREMKMTWRGNTIVNLKRDFLDTNGAKTYGDVVVEKPSDKSYFDNRRIYETLREGMTSVFRNLNTASQKGLMNIFDSTIGSNTVLMPYGGKTQRTQQDGLVMKIPVENGETDTAALMAYGFNPEISKWSPFHGAMYAVVESVIKLISMGGDPEKVYLSFQEYFERLGDDPKKWGKPFSALLGALYAQHQLKMAAIGGKDSMSGTFEDMNVPPTLISFAVTTGSAKKVVSAEFKTPGNKVVAIATPVKGDGTIDFEEFKKNIEFIAKLISEEKVISSCTIGYGGIFEAIGKMCFGNNLGLELYETVQLNNIQKMTYGSVVLEVSEGFDSSYANLIELGEVKGNGEISYRNETVLIDEAYKVYSGGLEDVFSQSYDEEINEEITSVPSENKKIIASPMVTVVKPKVIIPVFPGTNCEYDCRKAFVNAGADAKTLVFNNMSPEHIRESIEALKREIETSQIIMLPGGFSAGDEPDGSGKFISAIFRNEEIKNAVHELLYKRDGLMLGICNGFQALIKLGLVPYGEIRDISTESPTLVHNRIGKHQSMMVTTKVVTNKSPWLSMVNEGDEFVIPISHGEGRFFGNDEIVKKLFENGQVATQYVDESGNPTYDIRFNPNGSVCAIEGITSIDGRIFGKMGHSERFGSNIIKNVPGKHDMKIFESGVNYFK